MNPLPTTTRPPALLLLLCLALLLSLATPLAHAKRVALVVGNAAYAEKPLRNPVNDAELMQRTLQGLGFEVSLVRNADRRTLLAGLRDFEARARNADVALFYFAGHGTQVGGSNYLLPLQAQIRAESDVPDEAVDATSVLRRIEDAKARVGLVILDACRDNPYAGAIRSSSRGLGRMNVPTGSIVAYATAPGSTADDGSGQNGVYTEQLAKQLGTPGLDLREVFDRTASEVERLTGGKQKPREDVGLRGRFVLKEDPGTQVASVVPVPTGVPVQADPDQEAWELAKRRDTVAAYQGYLGAFPSGRFAGSARSALAGLQPAAAVAQPVQPQALQQPTSQPPLQAATPAGQAFRDCQQAHCPELVVIPAGSFTMGSNDGDADEKPQRSVSVRSFALGKYEVTQGQWTAVMGSNPSYFKQCGDNCPVEVVPWNAIQQYLSRLNQMTGQQYRLASEAEWEYAARAGSTTKYSWGNEIGRNRANCDGCGSQWDDKRTAPVGQFPANGFGLHDMHGNVWEWVQDAWHDNYADAPTDGSAWMAGGNQRLRVLRGGSWNDDPDLLRSAFRGRFAPASAGSGDGFRIARNVP